MIDALDEALSYNSGTPNILSLLANVDTLLCAGYLGHLLKNRQGKGAD